METSSEKSVKPLKNAAWALLFFLRVQIFLPYGNHSPPEPIIMDVLPDVIGWAILLKIACGAATRNNEWQRVRTLSWFGFGLSFLVIARPVQVSQNVASIWNHIQLATFYSLPVFEVIVVWQLWQFALSASNPPGGKWAEVARNQAGITYMLKPIAPLLAGWGSVENSPIRLILLLFPFYAVGIMIVTFRTSGGSVAEETPGE